MGENTRTPRRPAIVVAKEARDKAEAAFNSFMADAGLERDAMLTPGDPLFASWAKVSHALAVATARVAEVEAKAVKTAKPKDPKRLDLTALTEAGRAAVLAVYNEQLAKADTSDEDAEIKARVQAKRAAREAEAETDSVEELLGLL